MQTVSSYGVEIRKQNIPIRQTLKIYRQAVSYLTEIDRTGGNHHNA